MIKRIAIFLLLAVTAASAADSELVNSKSGIDLTWGGTKGTDYAEEYLYHVPNAWGAKVVYIRDTTSITASHNVNNIAGAASGSDQYESVGTGVGQIRYKVDGDYRWALYPTAWTAYSAPFDFGDLNYGLYGASGTAVVGTTGLSGTLSLANKGTTYYRGILDSFGDEWHILTVADDDGPGGGGYASAGDEEFDSSDGKVFYFVVNPKTPALTLRTNASTGQFYTTPAKKYFIPVIYDQTSHINDGVQFQVTDLYGSNVVWRINAGAWSTNASGSYLTSSSFTSGATNTFEYFSDRGSKPVKTRLVVRNPTYPSAVETHGDRFWGNATQFTNEVKVRINGNADLLLWLNKFRADNNYTGVENGKRNAGGGDRAAFAARFDGPTSKKTGQAYTHAENAKRQLFEVVSLIDPVGAELHQSNNPIPSREMLYRGYWDVDPIHEATIAYDYIAGYFRSNQGYALGLTAIEDYFIRDALAAWVHMAMLQNAGFDDEASAGLSTAAAFVGMWQFSRLVGASGVAFVMPSYSTEYYGTCGIDGNTATWPHNPFVTDEYTWKEVLFDNSVTVVGFPNVHKKVGLEEYQFLADGAWSDKIGYTQISQMGHNFIIYRNLLKLVNPTQTTPRFALAMADAAGTGLRGSQGVPSDLGPSFRAWPGLQNAWFESFRTVAQPAMLALASTSTESLGKQINASRSEVHQIIWHDHDLAEPGGAVGDDMTAPTLSAQSVNPGAVTADLTFNTNESATNLVEIGTSPGSYIAYKYVDSQLRSVHSHTFTNLASSTTYYYRIKAGDQFGNVTTDSERTFTTDSTDVTNPAITLDFPADDANVSGSFQVRFTATDNVGVSSIVLWLNGSAIQTNTVSQDFSVNSLLLANGTYDMYGRAYDAAGNTASSATNQVVIANNDPQPVVRIPFITSGASYPSVMGTNVAYPVGSVYWTNNGLAGFGGAIVFPGTTNDYIYLPDSPEVGQTTNFTVMAWIKPESTATWQVPFMKIRSAGSHSNPWYSYTVQINHQTDTTYRFNFGVTEDGANRNGYTTSYNYDEWQHIGIVWNGTDVRCYVNGALAATVTATGTLTTYSGQPLRLGVTGLPGSPYKGMLDELRIFNEAIDALEADEQFNLVPDDDAIVPPTPPQITDIRIPNVVLVSWNRDSVSSGNQGGVQSVVIYAGSSPTTITNIGEVSWPNNVFLYSGFTAGSTNYLSVATRSGVVGENGPIYTIVMPAANPQNPRSSGSGKAVSGTGGGITP